MKDKNVESSFKKYILKSDQNINSTKTCLINLLETFQKIKMYLKYFPMKQWVSLHAPEQVLSFCKYL